jgi:hypothetical protein
MATILESVGLQDDIANRPKVHQHVTNRRTIVIVPADDAGEFRQLVIDGTEVRRLFVATAITAEMLSAAEKWSADWYNSGLAGHGESWRGYNGGKARSLIEDMNESQEKSWRAYAAALDHVPHWARNVTTAVVLDNLMCKNLTAIRAGLAALAQHYERI